ncbi:MAG: S41 family peptidase [Thermodesulfobacteriota bacterium]
MTSMKRLVVLILLVGLLIAPGRLTAQENNRSTQEDTYAKIKVLSLVLHEIQKKYVEDTKPEELIYGAIRGMLRTLDPHSAFMTPEEMKDFQVETRGSFSGVGIEITIKDGLPVVVSPIEGSPAHKAGLQVGDQILKIDGASTKDMTLLDVVRRIRGPQGSTVVLTVVHEGEQKPLDVPIVRAVIPLRSVRYEVLEKGYGYIRVTNFQGDTADAVEKALTALQSETPPLKGLILDLRSNPGGLLDQSVRTASHFLKSGGLVVYTKGKIEEQNMELKASGGTRARDFPMVVLVNEGSASASEIVAGALQDHKRALVVGAKTFGKGSVQTIIPLPDGSGLRLTTARYYTPLGRSIQATGINPDVLVPSRLSRRGKVLREKDLDQHLTGENETSDKTGPIPEETPEGAKEESKEDKGPGKLPSQMTLQERLEADPQLKRALEMLKKNEVQSLLKAAKAAK